MSEEKTAGLRRHSEEINRVVKESLRQALIILLQTTSYDKITVSAVCKKAGVSRMAFYGNFDGKDDLLEAIVEDLNKTIYLEIGSPFSASAGVEWYLRFFKILEGKKDILFLIFDAGFRKKYFFFVNELILHNRDYTMEEKYRRLIWSGGIENVIVYWRENGMRESTDELAKFCATYLKPQKNLSGYLRGLFNR